MTAVFYGNFSKRRNSTKQPTGGTSKTVVLKEGTSVMKPSFLLTSPVLTWNYCSAFGNYYYIRDIVLETNDLFRVECELDVMATFKNAIGNYTTLVSRAASDQNYDVIDGIYPAKTVPDTQRVQITNPGLFTTTFSSGCIVFGTIGAHGQNYYVMTPSQFSGLCSLLFPGLQATGGGTLTLEGWLGMEVSQALVGGLNSIMESVTLLKWLPINYSAISSMLTTVSEVHIGNWTVQRSVGSVSGSISAQILGTAVTFPARADAGARGKWLYAPPFASYSLYIPPFGLIQIDGAYMFGAGRQVSIDIMADIVTGTVTLRLYYALGSSGPKMIGVYNANIAADMRAGGGVSNLGGIASGIAGAVSSIISENYAGAASSIMSAAQNAIPQASQIGGGVSGPVPDLAANWYAYATYFDPIDEDQAEFGRPLCEMKQINTLSGYVKCANASLSIPGHAEEMSEINGFLNGGFFYE